MAQDNPFKVVTGEVRLSFVHLFDAVAQKDSDKKKYSCTIIIPKADTKTVNAIKAAQKAALTKKFKDDIPRKWTNTLHDGDEEADLNKYPEYKNSYYMSVSANEAYPPKVVDADLNPIMDRSDVYSGVYGRVSLSAFGFDQSGNKGVGFGLNNVQILRDGDPLGGGGSSVEDDFGSSMDDDDLGL